MAGRFSLEAVFGAKDYASKVIDRIHSRFQAMTKGFGAGMKDVSRINDRVLGSMNNLATKAALAGAAVAGIGVVGGLMNVAKTATDFEQAITNVGAVALQTRDQIGDLEKKALELGRDTQFTATQAAQAMEVMKRAGFSNADVLSGIGGVLDATAASGLEMSEVAGIVSNALKGMGLQTSEATRVADVLALASSKTNSTMGTLGESLANVASTARQLKIPLEDTVSAVAMLQDVGLDASVAGSAFNTMLTQMASPTDDIRAKMQKWGISFKDAKGNMLPLQKVLEQLAKASAKSGGTFDQVAFFADLVGLRGQKAASNLAYLFTQIDKDTGKNKVQALTEDLENASGAARKMANIRMDTLQGDVTLLGSSLDLVKIAAFETAGKGLRPIVQEATKWVNANKDLIATKVTTYLKSFAESLPTIVYWASKIGRGAVAFYSLSLGIKAVSVAMSLASMNPWVAGVYAAITAITLLVAFWPEIKRFYDDHRVAIGFAVIALTALGVAMYGERAAALAVTGGLAIAKGAHLAYAAVSGAVAAANGTMAVSFSALLVPIAAVAAAAAAALAAYDQVSKLNKETEGLGITGIIGQMVTQGTWDPFKAVDEYQNEQARSRAANAPQTVAPRNLTPIDVNQTTNNNTTNEVVIRDQTGRAAWKTPPKAGVPVKLAPSGGY